MHVKLHKRKLHQGIIWKVHTAYPCCLTLYTLCGQSQRDWCSHHNRKASGSSTENVGCRNVHLPLQALKNNSLHREEKSTLDPDFLWSWKVQPSVPTDILSSHLASHLTPAMTTTLVLSSYQARGATTKTHSNSKARLCTEETFKRRQTTRIFRLRLTSE